MQLSLERQGQVAAIVVIAIGYLVTFNSAFAKDVFPFSVADVVISLVAGLVYLRLLLRSDIFFSRYASPRGTAVLFVIQIALVLTVQWLLPDYLIWLIALPLVGTAVEYLSPHWRWPVYVTPIVGIVLPLSLQEAMDNQLVISLALSASAAVVFVVVFTKQSVNERGAREKAEQLSRQLELANQQLRIYAVQAEELATVAERNRLAREIHDNLGHYLTVVNVQLEAARTVMAEDPAKAHEAINKAQDLTQRGLTAVRQSVRALRELPVGNRPLSEAITTLVNESQSAGIQTQLRLNGEPRPLPADAELALYRVVQEGLTNIRRHAQANQATVYLDYQPEQVQLTVEDDGVGTADNQANGFGLIGIRERIGQLNGRVAIHTLPHQGFTLSVTIPI